MAYHSENYIAIPPGATISEVMGFQNISHKQFAHLMGMTEADEKRLIDGSMKITPDIAERLSVVLGPPANFWNGLETNFRERLSLVETENDK